MSNDSAIKRVADSTCKFAGSGPMRRIGTRHSLHRIKRSSVHRLSSANDSLGPSKCPEGVECVSHPKQLLIDAALYSFYFLTSKEVRRG